MHKLNTLEAFLGAEVCAETSVYYFIIADISLPDISSLIKGS